MKSRGKDYVRNIAVLKKNDFTCEACGASAQDFGSEAVMRTGYIARNDASLKLTAEDIKVLCPDCDEGFSRAELLPRLTSTSLLVEIRRATAADQRAVLDWLLKRYPQRA